MKRFMHYLIRILVVIIAAIISFLILLIWLYMQDPAYLIHWWNHRIKTQCDVQDNNNMNGIPSYIDAWNSNNSDIIDLHRLITLHHDEINNEVNTLITYHDGDVLDTVNETNNWLKTESRWRPVWIKLMGEFTSVADNLPTLKTILQNCQQVPDFYISIFYPGMTVVESQAHDRSMLHYQYGLNIPYSDVGLKINGFDAKWQERSGQVWDNTLPHSAWNHTDKPRIVLFANVYRQLSSIDNLASKLIHYSLKNTPEVAKFQTLLQHSSFKLQ